MQSIIAAARIYLSHLGLSKVYLLVTALCLCLPTPGVGQVGTISFAQQQLVVDEGSTRFTTVQIPLVRDGGTSGAVVVTITVSV